MFISGLALWSCGNFSGQGCLDYALGFYFVYAICLFSFLMGAQASLDEYGIGYAVWALVIGMFVSNLVLPIVPGLGKVLEPIAGSGEFFIKVYIDLNFHVCGFMCLRTPAHVRPSRLSVPLKLAAPHPSTP